MTYGEAKDIVREHFGRLGFTTPMVIQALAGGRRAIEQHANFWWMRADPKTFNLTINQNEYLIKVSTSNGLNVPLFKDIAALYWKVSTDTQWEIVDIGKKTKHELDLEYATDEEGTPEQATIDNVTLAIYPPEPQVAYNMKMYYWNWTANPQLNSSTDDILSFFPDALIYAANAWGYEMQLKDFQGASYWKQLLGGQPFGRGGQLATLKRENLKRGWKDMINLDPHTGPNKRGLRRKLDNVQIYR